MTEIRRHTRFASAWDVARALQPTDPVYCVRPHAVREASARFVEAFPGRVLYALKCNPHPTFVESVVAGGVEAFDTASLSEVRQIRENWPTAACYFMNPVKSRAAITTARHVYGISHFVVDHVDELYKLSDQLGSDSDVVAVVRMTTEKDHRTTFHLAEKFGAEPPNAVALLREARALGFHTGLAFHVGSQCLSPEAYSHALKRAGEVIAHAGVPIVCLDVGGGFPARYGSTSVPTMEDFMAAIRVGLERLALPAGCEIIAEPGRALVAEGCSLLLQVHLRKGRRLYVNDGIYGSLSEVAAAGLHVPAELIRFNGDLSGAPQKFDLAGPTCDSLDIIHNVITVPDDVKEGDWLALHSMGAYSNTLVTCFNGFNPDTFVEVTDDAPRHD